MGYCRSGSLDQYCFISGSLVTPISISTAISFNKSCSSSSLQLLHRRVLQSPVWSAYVLVCWITSCLISLVNSLRKRSSSVSVLENGIVQPLIVSSKSETSALKFGSVCHCQGAVHPVNPNGVPAVSARCQKFQYINMQTGK